MSRHRSGIGLRGHLQSRQGCGLEREDVLSFSRRSHNESVKKVQVAARNRKLNQNEEDICLYNVVCFFVFCTNLPLSARLKSK